MPDGFFCNSFRFLGFLLWFALGPAPGRPTEGSGGGLPGAPGPPRARVNKKTQCFLQSAFERQSSTIARRFSDLGALPHASGVSRARFWMVAFSIPLGFSMFFVLVCLRSRGPPGGPPEALGRPMEGSGGPPRGPGPSGPGSKNHKTIAFCWAVLSGRGFQIRVPSLMPPGGPGPGSGWFLLQFL